VSSSKVLAGVPLSYFSKRARTFPPRVASATVAEGETVVEEAAPVEEQSEVPEAEPAAPVEGETETKPARRPFKNRRKITVKLEDLQAGQVLPGKVVSSCIQADTFQHIRTDIARTLNDTGVPLSILYSRVLDLLSHSPDLISRWHGYNLKALAFDDLPVCSLLTNATACSACRGLSRAMAALWTLAPSQTALSIFLSLR
jgi:hypothetical protein